MNPLLLVSFGGVAGTLIRFGIGIFLPSERSGTLAANLIGVALASALLVLMERHGTVEMRLFLLPGFCSGLTTFSALAIHSIEPAQDGGLYVITTLVLSLAIVAAVLPLARKIIPVRQ
jgi:fluoride exporter